MNGSGVAVPAAARRLPRAIPGRVAVAAAAYAYVVVMLANGGHGHWNELLVPALAPPFADMLSLTTAWECVRDGVDPLRVNPCDPFERPANYPRLWLALAPLGLGQGATLALGLLTALAFLAAVLRLVPRRTTPVAALAWAVAVVSPAVVLGVERANPDLLLFALLVLALALLRRPGSGRVLAVGALVLAAMLKLYPAAAFAVLLRQRPRRALATAGIAAASFGAYAVLTLADIRDIAAVVPKDVWFSYGAQVGLEALGVAEGIRAPVAAAGLAVLALAAAAAARLSAPRRSLRRGLPSHEGTRALDAFWVGALVYAGSFATAYNWDYRLVFLLLTLPQLLRWAHGADGGAPGSRAALAAVLATLWLGEWLSIRDPGAPWEELLNWGLFGWMLYGVFLTLPRWLADRVPGSAAATTAPAR